ncbi:HlyC/CorC family transporter [Mogibacterium kristiansenii]|uniref:HlyC/CorC family transporter n=1 Tax=Mogibacterium kristiansenii TaxID=2606708 RepID=A0A6N7XLV7_9FIRM|nr:hemolysin family protein [Mogibacterium kristiansenii]MDD6700204.1 hemolysin family protein [Mogibacterium kristiansenii]MEE1374123.1 hemolysin family protein [Clostridia bacterium]MST71045.1 HlyC/CorC family transporter [Mogibacterium kristiansenii]
MTAYIFSILCLLLLSAFFSATETAFTSLNRIKMKNMANDDVKNAKLVLKLEDRYDKLLSTILIGNNIANIGMTAIATVMFVALLGGSLGPTASTVVMTVAVLIFGEISPKNIAKEHPEGFALFAAPIMRGLMWLFTPLNVLFSLWKKLLGKLFGTQENGSYTEDELITIVEEAQIGGSIGKEQQELITNAIEFDDLEAIDVITPRVDIVAVELGTSVEEIGRTFKESGLSRLPVYEDDLDNIIGIINQKDFHNYVVGENRELEQYIKPVAYVAESIKAAVLLKKMQTKKTHIAIIVDEYGGTTGLVTMEDIIEELVGKIYDEHDAIEMREVTRLYDGSYSVAGGANVEKFFEMVGEDIDINATTINGWVMIELDRLAKVGDTFTYRSRHKIFHVRVTRADERRALMVQIRIEDIPEEDE